MVVCPELSAVAPDVDVVLLKERGWPEEAIGVS